MKSGYTTGSCVAAGTKAGLFYLCFEEVVKQVEVFSPQGDETIVVPIQSVKRIADGVHVVVVKYSGDDPDITNGIEIHVDVTLSKLPEIVIQGGKGVGVVTKPGLSVEVGKSAINPGPCKMICSVAREILGDQRGCTVLVSIPEGEKLAKRTLNSTLGILGGLSVIGTSGIVRPMSEEAFKNSLSPQIYVAKAAGYHSLVFAPGKIGQDIAIKQFKLPANAVIQTSNFIGHMLECAAHEKMDSVLLLGHLGKLVKVAAGIFHTHNRMADARMETLAAYAAVLGASRKIVQEILDCTTTEAAMPIIAQNKLTNVYSLLAKRASIRATRYVFNDLKVGTVIVTLKGELLGMDEQAKDIGGQMGWNIK